MNFKTSIKNVGYGFSSDFVFLKWAIFGGFLSMMIDCEFLSVMIQPVYEKPIKTIEDVIGIILIKNYPNPILVLF